MSFSAEWLALREPVDHRSRNADVAEAVRRHFAGHGSVNVVDFGCGTGSNLRATFALLGDDQSWTLVDYDETLLAEARKALSRWADSSRASDDRLMLQKSGASIVVQFRRHDLNAELETTLSPTPDLVTASALFDLISERWIKDFARRLAEKRCAFYTVLTYDGRDEFAPAHPADDGVIAAFAVHQGGDKGFGPAAGPQGADALARAFSAAGYRVEEGDSPWRLGAADAALARDLLKGVASAVAETGRLAPPALKDWLDYRLARLRDAECLMLTGHRDTFATPK
jgi:hypothetical protein